jgi:hypothetical protein
MHTMYVLHILYTGGSEIQQEELLGMLMHGLAGMVEKDDEDEDADILLGNISWADILRRSEQRAQRLLDASRSVLTASSDIGKEEAHRTDTVSATGENDNSTLEALLSAKSRSSKLFKGIDYEKVKPQQKKTCYIEGDGNVRIADAWNERTKREVGPGRIATVTLQGVGKVGEVPERVVVDCNNAIETVRKPSNNYQLFMSENSAAAQKMLSKGPKGGGHLMKVLATQWHSLPLAQKEVYNRRAKADRVRFLSHVGKVVSSFGKFTPPHDASDVSLSVDDEHPSRVTCEVCGKGSGGVAGDLIPCTRCPSALHACCMPRGSQNATGAQCGHHKCHVCLKAPTYCGGALLYCTRCPKSFCGQHRPEGSVVTRKCEWAERLGFTGNSTTIFFECGDCRR